MNMRIDRVAPRFRSLNRALLFALLAVASLSAPGRGASASQPDMPSATASTPPAVPTQTPDITPTPNLTPTPPANAAAAAGHSYSLADFLDIVLARSPGIESAILRAKAADYKVSSVRASYLPKLSAVGQVGAVKGTGISPLEDLSDFQPKATQGFIDGGGGSLNIPLFTEGSFLGINTPPKAAIYDAIRSQAQSEVLLTRDQIRLQAIEAYYLAFEDAKKSTLIDREVSMLNQLANIAEIQYNHQIISKQEFENSKIRVALAAQDLEESEWDAANAFVVVAALLGIDNATTVHLPAEQPLPKTLPSFEVVISHVLQSNPTLMQQVAVLKEANAQHAFDVTKFEPTATISNSYQYGDDFSGSGRYQLLSLLRISVPIFDGGENYYELRSSSKLMEAEKASLYQTKLNLENDLHHAYESVENLRRIYLENELLSGQKEILVQQDQALSSSGAISIPDFVDAQLGYVNAALTTEESYYTMMAAYADLDKASAYAGLVPLLGSHVRP
jgi:outer membrane protein TolC